MRIDVLNRQMVESMSVQYNQRGCPVDKKMTPNAEVELGKFKGFLKDIGYQGNIESIAEKDIEKLIKMLGEDSTLLADLLCKVEDLEVVDLEEIEQTAECKKVDGGMKGCCSEKKYNAIKQEKDSMYLSNLENEIVSVNSLYAGSFAGTPEKIAVNYSREELESLLIKNGVPVTDASLWGTNKLLEYGIDISATNISKIQNIKTAVDSLKYQEKIQEDFEENTGIDEDQPIMKDDKLLYSEKDIESIKETLGSLSQEELQEAIKLKDISINTLKKIMHENTNKVLKKTTVSEQTLEQVASEQVSQEEASIGKKVEELKSNIETIRLKLTVESAQKLSGKMSLEFNPLADIAKELLAEETAQIKKAFEKADINVGAKEISLVQKIATAAQKAKLNLDVVPIQDKQLSLEKIETFIDQYAINETTAKAQFKEGFSKIADQIPQLLESLGVEVDQLSTRAAKALILNDVAITPDTINEASKVLAKVDLFVQELTPFRAVELLQNGLNPYTAEIDKVLEWSGTKNYPVFKENVAEMLVTIEKKGIATQEQKEALMGLYKVLNSVDKNKEAVAGYLFKKGGLLSVDKFNEALKTMKKHIEIDVDDSFGEKVEIKNIEKQAKQIIENTQKSILREKEYVQKLELSTFNLEDIDPSKKQEIKADLYTFLRNHLKKELATLGLEKTIPAELAEKVEYIKDVNPMILQKMSDNNIPLSIFNIFWTKKMYDGNERSNENSVVKADMEFPKTVEEFNQEVERLIEKAEQNKGTALKKGDLIQYQATKENIEELTYQKNVLNKNGVYQIPFVINGEHRTVNLFIEKKDKALKTIAGEKETIATISYDTKSLGKIKAKISLKGEEISYDVYANNTEARACLDDEKEILKKVLENIGKVILGNSYKIAEVGIKPSIRKGGSLFEEVV